MGGFFFFTTAQGDLIGSDFHREAGVNITVGEANYVLSIKNNTFIKKVLIPFFDSMVWYSKKELDYKDWKTQLKIKELGLHLSDDISSYPLASYPLRGLVKKKLINL